MLAKRLLGLLFASALTVGSVAAADIIVKEHPPKAVVETRGHAPGKGYVWVPGYHRWDGSHCGRKVVGTNRLARTRTGCLRNGCIVMTGTCLSKDTGAKTPYLFALTGDSI